MSLLCFTRRHLDTGVCSSASDVKVATIELRRVASAVQVLVAEAWCPVSGKARVQSALRDVAQATSATVRPARKKCFQGLGCYGIRGAGDSGVQVGHLRNGAPCWGGQGMAACEAWYP